MYLTETAAHRAAARRSKKINEPVWVIFESGEFDTATEEELGTFYLGLQESSILGAYFDGEPESYR